MWYDRLEDTHQDWDSPCCSLPLLKPSHMAGALRCIGNVCQTNLRAEKRDWPESTGDELLGLGLLFLDCFQYFCGFSFTAALKIEMSVHSVFIQSI